MMLKRGERALAVAVCLGLNSCTQGTRVTIERLQPPLANVSGIREIAILPIAMPDLNLFSGPAVGERIAAVVADTNRYRVMRNDQVARLLAQVGINYAYPPDTALVRKIGAALKVDAVLFGELEQFNVQEEQRLIKVREAVWGGDYVRDHNGAVVTDRGPDGEETPRKRFQKRLVEKDHLRRYAVLDLHLRVADTFVGNVICAESETESGSWEGTGAAEVAKMPAREVIFELLLDRGIKKFVRQIAAHPVEEERVLEPGLFHATRLGVELARNNLWDEAMEKWLQSTKAKPDDPAAYYDLGVGFERKGMFDLAYKAYQNALARKPQSTHYIKAVATMQKLIKEMK
ncbi:MAG: hypothetical protein NT045_07570 [Candidatus Aureabacteria bacterium]|nr:hypothetical protein [Candidatus Auribacterota bacterium]